MKYPIIYREIPQEARAEINQKILDSIDANDGGVTPDDIYNSYTGLGGLHNLEIKNFANYAQFAKAKQSIEMGQFFTPHELCQRIVEIAAPKPTESVIDMGCGMGNFFNFLPNLYNAYGIELDSQALKVARYLYPEADIQLANIVFYNPPQRFDILLGNPPYNLQFGKELSQFFYAKKAYEILNPAGLMLLVVPRSFMQSEFWNKSQVRTMERMFSFLGQTILPQNTFQGVGVESYETKVMAFARETAHLESNPYNDNEFISLAELGKRVAEFRIKKQSLKLKLLQETNFNNHSEEEKFNYKVKKYLFELQAHQHLRNHYDMAVALLTKFRNQIPPQGIVSDQQYREYEKSKLTYAKVLSVLRRYIQRQYDVPRKEVALVKTNYTFKLKAYAPNLLDSKIHKETSINDLILKRAFLPYAAIRTNPKCGEQDRLAYKFIERKRREYQRQNLPYEKMEQDESLTQYINGLSFINKENVRCEFLPLQKHDMNLLFQKRYNLLNWQQGSGKTAVAYHYAQYVRALKRVHNTIIAAPANAIEMTWEPFLQLQNERYVCLRKQNDLNNIAPGVFILVSISMLGTLERAIKRFIRLKSNKLCLIFDESDELTNHASKRTQRSLCLFRRLKFKILTTGTTTRNNVSESYPQLELMYNNSVNMICWCSRVYFQDRVTREIHKNHNLNYAKPFPAKGGSQLYKSCFCPAKVTVFGLEKHNQDIYNKNFLYDLVSKSILTRKFKDFAGDKYKIITHNVTPPPAEKAVYEIIYKKFGEICNQYFNSTGDSRKYSAMKMIRQIQLLIKACSIPNRMVGYEGLPFPEKVRSISKLIRDEIPGKVAIGCTTIDAMEMYSDYISLEFPLRPLFLIHGDVSFKKRNQIIENFENTHNGILVCTQQSLKSSVNIPTCDDVIIESLLWNIPRMEQFYFRFIRLDSKELKRVHFFPYAESIEQNILALVTTKESLNEFIKSGVMMDRTEIFYEFDISPSLIENLLRREQDEDGNFYIEWGTQKIS